MEHVGLESSSALGWDVEHSLNINGNHRFLLHQGTARD
jgi:hypothetical protein